MQHDQTKAKAEFLRSMKLIVGVGIMMVVAALFYLRATGDLTVVMIIATIGGVFVSMVLGCGLFALAFFSAKSGHDQDVSDSTTVRHGNDDK